MDSSPQSLAFPSAVAPVGSDHKAAWDDLLPQHRYYLEQRAVAPDVAAERGYFSITKKVRLEDLGFRGHALRVPSLVIPLWAPVPTDEPVGHQHHPDDPRRNPAGKPNKFERPSGARMRLDVHPRMRPLVGDPDKALFITEGIVKADAAVSHLDVCTAAIAGVWCWRGSNEKGGRAALTDFQDVPLNREVFLWFDSDVATKPPVHDAFVALGEYLEHHGAKVYYGYLDRGPHGINQGLDDWLMRRLTEDPGITSDDLIRELLPKCEEQPKGRPPRPAKADEPIPVVDGGTLAKDLHRYIKTYVAFPSEEAAVTTTLWAFHCHALQAWDSTPRLAIVSPEKGSGKSRLLEVLETVVPTPRHSVNMTPAVLFRIVAAEQPTLLFDEADTYFGPHAARDHEDLRALVNSGHRRGAPAYRMVGKGTEMQAQAFPAYAAAALAGIGDLPDTIFDRSVLVRMRRRAPGEHIEPFQSRKARPVGDELRQRLVHWTAAHLEELTESDPEMPEELVDRPADVWAPLLAVADAVGGEWPEQARRAAKKLNGERQAADPSLGVKLLSDIRSAFKEGCDRLRTDDLLKRLIAMVESPWGDIRGKPLDDRGLARRLRVYEVRPKKLRVRVDVDDKPTRGYERADFLDAWERYLPSPGQAEQAEQTERDADEPAESGNVPVHDPEAERISTPLTCDVPDVPSVPDIPGMKGNDAVCVPDNAEPERNAYESNGTTDGSTGYSTGWKSGSCEVCGSLVARPNELGRYLHSYCDLDLLAVSDDESAGDASRTLQARFDR